MTNNKVEATFHPDAMPANLMSASRRFAIAFRKFNRLFKTMAWNLRNGSMTDDEKLALRWVRMHFQEGRVDLVEEDLLWLGKRLEAKR